MPEQPTNLQGEATSATSIQLTWDEPRERDGGTRLAVDSYELYYNDSHLRQNVRVTISPPVNSYRLDDLTPDTVYHVRVSARSAARGESASTPTIQVRTPDYGIAIADVQNCCCLADFLSVLINDDRMPRSDGCKCHIRHSLPVPGCLCVCCGWAGIHR